MVKWEDVEQSASLQKCTDCGRTLNRTEPFVDEKGQSYVGYVCHTDKRVTWLKSP